MVQSRLLRLAAERGARAFPAPPPEPEIDVRDELEAAIDQIIEAVKASIRQPSDGVGVVRLFRDGDELFHELSNGEIERVGEIRDGQSIQGDPGVGVSRIFREGDFLYQALTDGTVELVGEIHDGINGESIKGDPGVSVKSLSVSGSTMIVGLDDGRRLSTSLAPIINRLKSEVLEGVFPLDRDNPAEIKRGKLILNAVGGETVELTLPSTKAAGGGISSQKARAISREISFVTVSSDYTAKPSDDVIEVTAKATITIPSGRKTWLQVKRSTSSNVTVKTDDGSLIEGETSRVLNVDLWAIRVAWNGSEYREF